MKLSFNKELMWELAIAIPAIIATPLFITVNLKIQAIGFLIFAVSNLLSIFFFKKNKKYVLMSLFCYYLSINLFGGITRLW